MFSRWARSRHFWVTLMVAILVALTGPQIVSAQIDTTSAAEKAAPASFKRLWRFQNDTDRDVTVWVRMLDVPWCRSVDFDDDGQTTIDRSRFGQMNVRFAPIADVDLSTKRQTGKVLIVVRPTDAKAGGAWLIRSITVDERPTIEPLVITREMLTERRDLLAIRNSSSHDIYLSNPLIQLPNEVAEEGKDYTFRTTGRTQDQGIRLAPGRSAVWLVLNHSGPVGGAARSVQCSLRTEGFAGRCRLGWNRHVEAVIEINDEHILTLASDAKERAAELARREAEDAAARQASAERAAAAEQERRQVALQRKQEEERRRTAAANAQNAFFQAAALLVAAAFVSELIGDSTWSQPEADQSNQEQLAWSLRRERERQEAEEAARREAESQAADEQRARWSTPDEYGR